MSRWARGWAIISYILFSSRRRHTRYWRYWSSDVCSSDLNEQGRVIVQMVVEADGSISNIKVIRSVSPSLYAEAMRVVGSMPKWKPGRQKGKAVAVKYTLPITFRLQKPPVEPQKK